jgi:hypothetical protein
MAAYGAQAAGRLAITGVPECHSSQVRDCESSYIPVIPGKMGDIAPFPSQLRASRESSVIPGASHCSPEPAGRSGPELNYPQRCAHERLLWITLWKLARICAEKIPHASLLGGSGEVLETPRSSLDRGGWAVSNRLLGECGWEPLQTSRRQRPSDRSGLSSHSECRRKARRLVRRRRAQRAGPSTQSDDRRALRRHRSMGSEVDLAQSQGALRDAC